jgi:hypothetical protein
MFEHENTAWIWGFIRVSGFFIFFNFQKIFMKIQNTTAVLDSYFLFRRRPFVVPSSAARCTYKLAYAPCDTYVCNCLITQQCASLSLSKLNIKSSRPRVVRYQQRDQQFTPGLMIRKYAKTMFHHSFQHLNSRHRTIF